MQGKLGKIAIAIAALGVLGSAPGAWADFVNLPASQDATLLGGGDVNSSLADPGMFVGLDGQGNVKRGLIEFNIGSKVPSGSIITAVTLTLTVGQLAGSGGGSGGGSTGAQTIGLFDESQAWGQPTNVAGATSFGGHGHGAAAATDDATWNDAFFNETAWTIPGGDWSSSLTASGSGNVPGALASFTWASTPAMVTDVQNWLDNPSKNFGWLLVNADEKTSTDFLAFWSAQGAAANNNSSIAPELTVTFTPEPGSGLLFSAAAGFLTCRRRRMAQ